ncbi:uncharacterized protein TNCV_58171 [Trichonephila clavipes]|nr:uncharacterized protein TNCV_58171 [Trichonephila clavipes]
MIDGNRRHGSPSTWTGDSQKPARLSGECTTQDCEDIATWRACVATSNRRRVRGLYLKCGHMTVWRKLGVESYHAQRVHALTINPVSIYHDGSSKDCLCNQTLSHTSYSLILNVWARIIHDHLIGPYLLPRCLDGGTYLVFLLQSVPANIKARVWFQHDGAPAHFSADVRSAFETAYPGR